MSGLIQKREDEKTVAIDFNRGREETTKESVGVGSIWVLGEIDVNP